MTSWSRSCGRYPVKSMQGERLVEAGVHGDHAEYFADRPSETSEAIEWTMPPERFMDAMPLLVDDHDQLLHAGAALHPARRVRRAPVGRNVLLDATGDGWLDDGLVRTVVRIGDRDGETADHRRARNRIGGGGAITVRDAEPRRPRPRVSGCR